MGKLKLIFNQTLMISCGILFGLGIEEMVEFLMTGDKSLTWQWYIPLSIIFAAFVCSVPSVIFYHDYGSGRVFGLKVLIHFICIFATVSFFAWLFGWYSTFGGYLVIAIMIFIIYGFVWVATYWLLKKDEEKINEALDGMRDEE